MEPKRVHETLKRFQLADGFSVVLDLERSHGSWVVDAITGKEYLDGFTCFASWPVGYNHPLLKTPDFMAEVARAAGTKVSNSDLYTVEMARFVETFATRVTPPGFPYHFWISGGSLAVENALKAAFDWKARKLGRTSLSDDVSDLSILHFKQAFHGRSGYTMSLTNTLPDKIGLFPKFAWPRVHNPALEFDLDGRIANDIAAEEKRSCAEIEEVFRRQGKGIAAIIIEPMQGEGGDNHFRGEFLARLREYANEEEALLIFDEVQTGFFSSGKPWFWQHHGVVPDIVCFGKKTQVCGMYVGTRIDEVENNVFHVPSRINSTWGGDLVDMVRARRFIEIIERERLTENTIQAGERLVAGLRQLAQERGGFSNVRGRGSLVAVTLSTSEVRKAMIADLYQKERVIVLPSGTRSIRFRLPFVITPEEIDEMLRRVANVLPARVPV